MVTPPVMGFFWDLLKGLALPSTAIKGMSVCSKVGIQGLVGSRNILTNSITGNGLAVGCFYVDTMYFLLSLSWKYGVLFKSGLNTMSGYVTSSLFGCVWYFKLIKWGISIL